MSNAATERQPPCRQTPTLFPNDPTGVAAVEFLDLAFNQKRVAEALDRYASAPYTQHNPQVPDGIDAAKSGLAGLLQQLPGWRYDFKRVLVDGDLVVVHSHVTTAPDDRGMAVVDYLPQRRRQVRRALGRDSASAGIGRQQQHDVLGELPGSRSAAA